MMARCSVLYHLLLVRSCVGQISLPRAHSGRVATHLGCVRQRSCVRHVIALERSLRPLATRLILSVFPSRGRDAAGRIRVQVPTLSSVIAPPSVPPEQPAGFTMHAVSTSHKARRSVSGASVSGCASPAMTILSPC